MSKDIFTERGIAPRSVLGWRLPALQGGHPLHVSELEPPRVALRHTRRWMDGDAEVRSHRVSTRYGFSCGPK